MSCVQGYCSVLNGLPLCLLPVASISWPTHAHCVSDTNQWPALLLLSLILRGMCDFMTYPGHNGQDETLETCDQDQQGIEPLMKCLVTGWCQCVVNVVLATMSIVTQRASLSVSLRMQHLDFCHKRNICTAWQLSQSISPEFWCKWPKGTKIFCRTQCFVKKKVIFRVWWNCTVATIC